MKIALLALTLLSTAACFASADSLSIDPALKAASLVTMTADYVNFDVITLTSYNGESGSGDVTTMHSPNVYGSTNLGVDSASKSRFVVKLDIQSNALKFNLDERTAFTNLTEQQTTQLKALLSMTSKACPVKFVVDIGSFKILRVRPTCKVNAVQQTLKIE